MRSRSRQYFVLFILLVRGLTLPGAASGLRYYLVPNFSKLTDGKVWVAAASQIFYSTGIGWGTLIAFASYNDPSHNFVRRSPPLDVCPCMPQTLPPDLRSARPLRTLLPLTRSPDRPPDPPPDPPTRPSQLTLSPDPAAAGARRMARPPDQLRDFIPRWWAAPPHVVEMLRGRDAI